MRRPHLLILILLLLLVIGACPEPGQAASQKTLVRGGALVVAISADPGQRP